MFGGELCNHYSVSVTWIAALGQVLMITPSVATCQATPGRRHLVSLPTWHISLPNKPDTPPIWYYCYSTVHLRRQVDFLLSSYPSSLLWGPQGRKVLYCAMQYVGRTKPPPPIRAKVHPQSPHFTRRMGWLDWWVSLKGEGMGAFYAVQKILSKSPSPYWAKKNLCSCRNLRRSRFMLAGKRHLRWWMDSWTLLLAE